MLGGSDNARGLSFLLCVGLLGCGANVVFGDEQGGGGQGTGAGNSQGGTPGDGGGVDTAGSAAGGSSSTGDVCDQLEKELIVAIDAARFCSPLDPNIVCDGTVTLLDTCGCPSLVANEELGAEIESAKLAYEAWVAAGCGPYPCESCTPAQGGFCDTMGGDGTSGLCQAVGF